jgi:hypothetical protein
MRRELFFRATLLVLLGSVVVYALTWWFYPKESGDPAVWQDVLIWASAMGFAGACLALVGGYVQYVIRGGAR